MVKYNRRYVPGAFHGEKYLIVNGADEKEAIEELSKLIEHGLRSLDDIIPSLKSYFYI